MSGGVDSSVAALLLSQQGYDVVGITMRLWSVERDDVPASQKRCCSVEDVEDARRVCHEIGIPHYFLNFEKEFQRHVIDYFVQEYDRGRTPHPCLACNDKIKFDFLLRRATFLEADYIATGHYGRVRTTPDGQKILLKGFDGSKDQSYVLFTLGQQELRRLLLPVGEYRKDTIRELAEEANLTVANKPDSQEICFIPDDDYRSFVGDRVRPKPGEMVDSQGRLLGSHPGIQFFTVGQRRGLGLKGNTGGPMYVIEIRAEDNRIVLGPEEELYRSSFWASNVSFVSGSPPEKDLPAKSSQIELVSEVGEKAWV
jgi:tRNA-specific 2-thiouridylase